MNYASPSNLLWLASMVLEAGILVTLFKRGLHRQYSRFTAYIALQLAGDIFLAFAHDRWPYIYYFGYWLISAVSIGLTLAILYEILRQTMRPVDPGLKIFSAVVRSIAFLGIATWPISLLVMDGSRSPDQVTELVLRVDRDLRILALGAGIGILILGGLLGVARREFGVGIVCGFVLYSFVRVLVATAMSHQTVLHRSMLSVIDLAVCVLADVVWLVYALRSPKVVVGGPEEAPPEPGPVPEGQAYA